jgi:hypothetical protein
MTNRNPLDIISTEARITFRDQLREARALAINDAEAYDQLLFSIERLGSALSRAVGGLKDFEQSLTSLAGNSALAKFVPKQWRDWHTPFPTLYDMVRDARNDALHLGAFARHLTAHAIQLEIILEDALMSQAKTVSDFMVRSPVCAGLWQPISFIRQQMLANSFSYLPVLKDGKWYLVSDLSIATYLRAKANERKQRLAHTLLDAIESGGLQLLGAICFQADANIDQVIKTFDGRPVLVCHRNDHEELIGILTAFDIL